MSLLITINKKLAPCQSSNFTQVELLSQKYYLSEIFDCDTDSPFQALQISRDKHTSFLKKGSIFIIGEGRTYETPMAPTKCNKESEGDLSVAYLLLTAYTRYGYIPNRCIDLNGSFGYVLVDFHRGVVYTCTDRFGSYKLYYSLNNCRLCISSEIRGILSFDNFTALPNWSTISNYLFRNYRYAYASTSTFFQTVASFPAGSVTSISDNLSNINSIPIRENENIFKRAISDDQAIHQFRDILEKSLEIRSFDTNNSEAYLLSGGLDSPTVAALAASRREPSNPINCYSLCFPESTSTQGELFYDESPLIKEIVASSNINWHPVYVDSRAFLETYDMMLEIHDEPISSPTWYSHWKLLDSISKKGHKIIFGGDGGDHILAGLYDDFPYFFADLYNSNEFDTLSTELQQWINMHSHPAFPKTIDLWQQYRDSCFDWKKPGQFHSHTWDESLFRDSHDYRSLASCALPPPPLLRCFSNSYLVSKLHQDLVYTSSPPSSKAEIPNLKAFGIELRSPLLDHELVDFCWNLPNNLMIRDGYTKYLIRIAMKDLLPINVLWNKKHTGLNSPANVWFRNDLQPVIEETINWPAWYDLKILDYKKTRLILNEHLDRQSDHMMFLWKLFSLKRWFEHHGNI